MRRPATLAAAIALGATGPATALAQTSAKPGPTPGARPDPKPGPKPDPKPGPKPVETPGASPGARLDAKGAANKDRVAQAKSAAHGPPPAPGTRPAKLVNLYNFWTKEWLAIDVASPPSAGTIDRFLRDHFTNKPAAMQPRLVELALAAAANFHSDVVDVVSGFRHPKYNLILRKKGHQVARDSQHSHGNAIDFYIPNVAAQALEAWAKAQKLGGVGLYPESGFVHMDIGPIRYWSGE